VNIQLEKHDDLNLTVIIALGKSDYQEKVEKEVKRIQSLHLANQITKKR